MEANALIDEVRELLDLLDFLDSLPIPELPEFEPLLVKREIHEIQVFLQLIQFPIEAFLANKSSRCHFSEF